LVGERKKKNDDFVSKNPEREREREMRETLA
jgi:hypothetical protein